MTQTLMLNLQSRATPFASQVPDQTYEAFEWLQEKTNIPTQLLKTIEDHADSVVRDLFSSIEKWKTNSLEEIAMFDRHEKAQIFAGNLL